MKKQIAFIPLTPLGDSILMMGELVELHRIYDPCEITVFAIPLIAELYRNFKYCDYVIVLKGGVHGAVTMDIIPDIEFDAVFNHGYEPWWSDIVRQLHYRKAYGMEEEYRKAYECEELFDKWVSLDYWKNVTMKKYPYVPQQMAELIRLVEPGFTGDVIRLSSDNYRVVPPQGKPAEKYVLFLPGTSALFKHYPLQKYFALAKAVGEMGYVAVFAIGPQDVALGNELRNYGCLIFESLPIAELAGLICGAELVVGNDSGPMHLAAVFDVPTIHLFSFSGAHTWFPYSEDRHRLLMPHCGFREGYNCGTCSRTCIGRISIKEVLHTMAGFLGNSIPPIRRVAYFPQDLIGDVLVWTNHLEALSEIYAPCEVVVFSSKTIGALLKGYTFVDEVVEYNPDSSWTSDRLAEFGHFDAVFNTRYDADSLKRVRSLSHDKAYGFENVALPSTDCEKYYDAYLPLSMWDDFHLRRETSVTSQGAELIKLVKPDYQCEFVKFEENTYQLDVSDASILHDNRIVFVLGASDRTKHWGTENYIRLALRVKELGYVSVFIIGPGELDYEAEITSHGLTVLKNLSFEKIAAVFYRSYGARCVVGNDTGLMHLACILGTPSVTIIPFGTQFTWFPYGEDDRALHVYCSPECARPTCSQICCNMMKCVEKISYTNVMAEVLGILERRSHEQRAH